MDTMVTPINNVLVFDDVTVKYKNDDSIILDKIKLSFNSNEIVAIIGKSGQGKTTLFKSLSHIPQIISGSILLNGKNISKMSKINRLKALKNVSFLNQESILIEEKTVFDNFLIFKSSFFEYIFRIVNQSKSEKINNILLRLGLFDKANTLVKELSGGQKQRVECGITLMSKPLIIMADEPTSNLDMNNAQSIIELLAQLSKELNALLIINMHDIELAKKIASRIIGIKDTKVIFDKPTNLITQKEIINLYE